MYDPDINAPPINPLPPVVILLACLIGSVELIFQAAEAGYIGGPQAIGWRVDAVQHYAFSDQLFDWMRQSGNYAANNMLRFVSYVFIHQSFLHVVFALVFVLAIGKFVGEIMNQFLVLLVFFGSAAGGAFVYSVTLNEQFAMIGAYPAVYGLIGAFTWLRFTALKGAGENGLQAFNLILFFMSIALIFKFLFGGSNDWLAELAGFCVGFFLTVVFGPNSKQRLHKMLARTRQR